MAVRTMRRSPTTAIRARRALRLLVAAAVTAMSFPLLAGTASAADFTNATPIVIPGPPPPAGCPTFPGPNNSCPATTATPYPSPITVAGLTGLITEVHVTLRGLTHVSPADLDVMVQAPDGKTVMLMSDACGADTDENPITAAIDLTLADAATGTLPADTACAAGSFKPVDDDNDPEFQFTGPDTFPAPAPTPATAVTLATFNGIDPNGAWNLWVVDDTPGDTGVNAGQFACGWALSVATPTTGALASPPAGPTPCTNAVLTRTSTTTTAAPAAARAATQSPAPASRANSASRAAGTPLAETGSNSWSLLTVAGLLMVGGWVLVRLARPKPTWPRSSRR